MGVPAEKTLPLVTVTLPFTDKLLAAVKEPVAVTLPVIARLPVVEIASVASVPYGIVC